MRAKKDIPPQPNQSIESWKKFENLRTNIRLLRAKTGLSAEACGKEAGFDRLHRIVDLEYGRGIPKLEEVELLAKYFNITIDELMYKKAKIIFE